MAELTKHIDLPVFQLNTDLKLVDFNDAFVELLAINVEELKEKYLWEVLGSYSEASLKKIINSKEGEENRKIQLKDPSGFQAKPEKLYEIVLNHFKTIDQQGFTGYCIDISDKVKSQNELNQLKIEYANKRVLLNEKSQKIDLIIQNSNIGIWEWDAETDNVQFSDATLKLLGYEPDVKDSEILFWSSVHPKDKDKIYKKFSDLITGKYDQYNESFRVRHRDGHFFHINSLGFSVRNEDGQVAKVVGIHENISEKVETGKKLIESEQLFRGILENVIDIYYRSDLNGKIKIVSPSIKRMLGYDQEEALGMNVIDFYKNKDARKELLIGLEKNGEVVNFNTYLLDKYNNSHFISANVKYVYDDSGSPFAIEGFLRDMTEQKLFETALKESEEHYKMLSDLTIEGVIIHNNGILLDVNEALIKMIGYKREELIGNNIIKVAVAPEYIALVKEKIEQQSTLPYHIEAYRKNGDRFWAEIESRNFEKDNHILRVTAIRDISRHKKSEKLLMARNEMLKSIEQGVSSKLGVDFFETVVKELMKLFKAKQAFIGEYDQELHTVYTLCNYKDGERHPNFKYTLDGTPCQNVVGNQICCYPDNVAKLFPQDVALKRDNIEAYLGAPLFDSKNRPIGILVTLFENKIEDVELVKSIIQIFSSRAGVEIERERMMEQLSESQRRFETLLSTLNGVFWIRNVNSNKIEYISPQYEQIWQRSADELYKNPDAFMEGVHPDDIKKVREGVKKIFDGQRFDLEYRIVPKNGEVRYIRSKSKLIENKKENIIREYGYGEDLTNFREAAMEINKLAQVARSTTNGVIILDEEGRIEWVNEAVLSYSGYTYEEMRGKLPGELMYEHIELKDGLHRINDSFFKRKNAVNEIKLKKKNGQSRWVKLSVQKFYEPITRKIKYLVTEVDITKIKKSEKAIQRQNEQLKKTNQELDNFVYRVSHDLKAPISSVKGLVNISRLENSSKPVEECLDLIDGSLIKLDTFIAEILDYSRNARMKIEYHDIELKKFISNILSDLKYIKGSDHIKKIIDVPEHFNFRSDSKRLTFIFNNLFSNAIRFADHDKEVPYIKISAGQKNGKVEITCADNGIGIDEEHQKHVFDMFYRATENQPGSGLGLYIVKESIDKLNGSIEMKSVAGEGTQFVLKIPDHS